MSVSPCVEGVELKLVRNPKEMSVISRPGLHQLPPAAMERIIFFLSQAEGKVGPTPGHSLLHYLLVVY